MKCRNRTPARVKKKITLAAEGVLTVCLARNSGVMSGLRSSGGTGFDYRVSLAIAEQLGLELTPVWFEVDIDKEVNATETTYAMLAHGLCDLVPAHPLYENAVGAPSEPHGLLPRWVGLHEEQDPDTGHRRTKKTPLVALRNVAVSHPYYRTEIGLVYAKGTPEPKDLQSLGSRRLAIQSTTLSGGIVHMQAPEETRARSITFTPGKKFLWELEAGKADVAIVDVADYDAHLKQNPISRLKLARWRHPIGFDIGIAALEENAALLQRVNGSLDALLADGTIERLAEAEGLHYSAPKSAEIAPLLTMKMLQEIR